MSGFGPALVGVALVAASVAAAPPAALPSPSALPEPARPSWAIVLARRQTSADAQAVFDELTSASRRWAAPGNGFPRIVTSGGSHLVVLGYCASRDEALAVQAWVKLDSAEAHIERLDAGVPEACPRVPRSALRTVSELVESIEVSGSPELRLDVVTGNERSEEECTTRDVVVMLRRGAQVLSETHYAGRCLGACTRAAKADGARAQARAQAAIDRGEATATELAHDPTSCSGFEATALQSFRELGAPVVLMKVETAGPHHAPYPKYELVTASGGCGELVRSSPFEFPHVASATGATVGELEARRVGRAGTRQFRLHDPTLLVNGADSRAVIEVKVEGCRMTVKPLAVE